MNISEEEYLKRWDGIIAKARQITEDKTKLYGVQSIGELGINGEFVQIHRKYKRLKNLVWDGDFGDDLLLNGDKYSDTLQDTLLDMLNYCAMMLIIIEETKNERPVTKD